MNKSNSFDLLRFFTASAVLVSHQFALLGRAEPMMLGQVTLGFFGVMIFFVLSGGLISLSWDKDPRPLSFLKKRCQRIFPALIFLVLVTVLLLGPLLSVFSAGDYFSNLTTWAYLQTAFLRIQYALPGVFENVPYAGVVNGSLWTLPVEFFFYLTILLAGVAGILKRPLLSALSLPFAAAGIVFAEYIDHEKLRIAFECAYPFWFGVVMDRYRRGSPLERKRLVAIGAISAVILCFNLLHVCFLIDLLIALALIEIANRYPKGKTITDRTGDWSYGIYIFAFPIQQIFVHLFGVEKPIVFHLASSLAATYLMAFFSWHVIEKRWLRRKV